MILDKRPQRPAKNKTDLTPDNVSCKRWDTPQINTHPLNTRPAARLFALVGWEIFPLCRPRPAFPLWHIVPNYRCHWELLLQGLGVAKGDFLAK